MAVWSYIGGKLVYESDIQNEYWNWEELFEEYLRFESVGDYSFTTANNTFKRGHSDYCGDVYLIVTPHHVEIHPRASFRYNKDKKVLADLRKILLGFFGCVVCEDLEVTGKLIEDKLEFYIDGEKVDIK